MKELLNPMELKVEFEYDVSEVVVTLSAHYGRGADGVSDRKGIPITLTSAQETTIKNFIKGTVVPQIKTAEGLV